MPDHVHLLLQPAVIAEKVLPLKTILQSLKGASSHSINRTLRRSGPVWQAESFDRVLRSSENGKASIQYILNNPVRRGLVDCWKAYRWIWIAEGLS